MASRSLATPSPVLTENEAYVLTLYDQLQQLQLELALLRSQRGHPTSPGAGASQLDDDDLADDQTRLLEAKATLALRNSIVEGVVAVQPTLRAVYDAAHASPVEQDLLASIQQRDAAATKTAASCSDLHVARSRFAELEVKSLHVSHQNIKLASEVLQLAGRTPEHKARSVEGGPFGHEIGILEGQVKSSHQRWKVMKGAASAIVAGSGIEWARDERLKDLVLDPPD